jgi:2-keto-3-deoxy-L-rhamnonate aldolase RhmA
VKSLKDALAAGHRKFGMVIRLARTAETVALARKGGIGWLFIDMEHSALNFETVQTLCLAGLAAGVAPLVRVLDVAWAPRVMDVGAAGIIVPHVEDAAQARAVAQACLYPPLGDRSISGSLFQLGLADLPTDENMRRGNEETVVVVMLESPHAVANADEIAAVPGVDILLIGSNDLAKGLGIPGKLGDPRMEAAFRTVIDACKRHGKQAGMAGIYDHDVMQRYLALGICFVNAGMDSRFMVSGMKARMDFLRGLPGSAA